MLEGRREVPLFASSVSYRLLPSCCRASAALRVRWASSSASAASHSSVRSIGASTVPPDTKPEDIVLLESLRIRLGS